MTSRRSIAFVVALSLTLMTTAVLADDEDEVEEIEEIEEVVPVSALSPFAPASWANPLSFAVEDRGVNLLGTTALRPKSLLLVIDHRTQAPVADLDQLLGFDAGGLKVGLGLRFGIIDGLDVGLYRLNATAEIFDTYQLDARYQILDEATSYVDLAVVGGMTWFVQPGMDDALGYLGQLMVGRTLFDRVSLSAGVLFHSDSSSDVKASTDTDWSLAVPGILSVRIASFLALVGEVAIPVAGYDAGYPAVSVSLKAITVRHTFSLVWSTTQYLTMDGMAAGSSRGPADGIIGFTITREVGF